MWYSSWTRHWGCLFTQSRIKIAEVGTSMLTTLRVRRKRHRVANQLAQAHTAEQGYELISKATCSLNCHAAEDSLPCSKWNLILEHGSFRFIRITLSLKRGAGACPSLHGQPRPRSPFQAQRCGPSLPPDTCVSEMGNYLRGVEMNLLSSRTLQLGALFQQGKCFLTSTTCGSNNLHFLNTFEI